MLYYYLESVNRYDIFDVSYRNKLREESVILDLKNANELSNVISAIKPDYVINCVGVLIKGSKADPGNAIMINSYLPHYLSSISHIHNYRLIHISTDCVFSGARGNYLDTDFRDSDDIYGRSKALGELVNQKDLTLRTSIIGPEIKMNGEGLFHWLLTQKGTVNGFTNVFWSGITTLELARIIELSMSDFMPGLYNIAPPVKISKYDLLKIISEVFSLEVEIMPYESKPIDKSLVCSNLYLEYCNLIYKDCIKELKSFMLNKKRTEYFRYIESSK